MEATCHYPVLSNKARKVSKRSLSMLFPRKQVSRITEQIGNCTKLRNFKSYSINPWMMRSFDSIVTVNNNRVNGTESFLKKVVVFRSRDVLLRKPC